MSEQSVVNELVVVLYSYHMQTDPKFRTFLKDRMGCSEKELDKLMESAKMAGVVR